MESRTLYNKICKYEKCGKEFTSEARNTRYCSDDCCSKAQVLNRSKNRRLKKRRDKYDELKEFNRLISRAYSLANSIGQYLPKECADIGDGHVCEGPMEIHHKDMNPFNNSPLNLEWRCRKSHVEKHSKLPRLSVAEILNEAFRQPNPYAVFEEYFGELVRS